MTYDFYLDPADKSGKVAYSYLASCGEGTALMILAATGKWPTHWDCMRTEDLTAILEKGLSELSQNRKRYLAYEDRRTTIDDTEHLLRVLQRGCQSHPQDSLRVLWTG